MQQLPFAAGLVLILFNLGAYCAPAVRSGNPTGDEQQRRCAAYLSSGQHAKARTSCGICLRYYPRSPECKNGLGLVAYLSGDDRTARRHFLEAIREDNDFLEARTNLGVLELEQGDFVRALQLFRSAVEIDPANQTAQYNLALAHMRYAMAEAASEPSSGRGTDRASPSVTQFLRALEEYSTYQELHPGDFRASRDLGFIHSRLAAVATTDDEHRARVEASAAAYRQCIDLKPDAIECLGNLGHLLLSAGQCEQSQAPLQACAQLESNGSRCSELLSQALSCSVPVQD